MGSIDSKVEQLLDYYKLQKKISNLKIENKENENSKLTNGYLFSSSLIKEWKIKMNYINISKYLDNQNIESMNYKEQKNLIKEYIKDNKFEFNDVYGDFGFILISPRLLSFDNLNNLINKKSLENLKKLKEKGYEEVKYIIKNRMIILIFDKYSMIKIIFYLEYVDELINITFIFDYLKAFENYSKDFEKWNSDEIFQYLLKIKIIFIPKYIHYDEEIKEVTFTVYNEEKYLNCKNENLLNIFF